MAVGPREKVSKRFTLAPSSSQHDPAQVIDVRQNGDSISIGTAQISADGFEIRKRTAPGHGWIRSAGGTRASGMGYVGGASGGVGFGMKDFWQSHPSQIDIRNADSDSVETTLWFWAPEAKAMDLGFYHDGLGMETLHQERQGGMAVTYEDYKEGMGTPYGVARTSEINFWIADATPSNQALLDYVEESMAPPLLAVAP